MLQDESRRSAMLGWHLQRDLVVEGRPVEPERVPLVLEALLDQQLRKMAEHALLVG